MYNEKELIAGCLNGKRPYQKALYEHFAGKMFTICLRYAKERTQAEDFLQEGFIKVFGKLKQYSGGGSFDGWVRRIMVNTALEHLRNQRTMVEEAPLDDDFEISSSANILEGLAAEEIINLIQDLPLGYKLVFNLYVLEGYSHKEIAKELGITEGTSKSQLNRARAILQKKFKKNENFKNEPVLEAGLSGR